MIIQQKFPLLIMKIFLKIKSVLNGDKNVIWPEEITWFAKSSGTTNDVKSCSSF